MKSKPLGEGDKDALALEKERTQHTPGPWTIITSPQTVNGVAHGGYDLRKGWPRVIAQDGHSVADIVTHSNRPFEANARLIAAAPELVEALRIIVRKAYLRPGPHEDYQVHPDLIEQARAVLAKVERGSE